MSVPLFFSYGTRLLNKFKKIRSNPDGKREYFAICETDRLSCNFYLIMSNCPNVCKKGLKPFEKGIGIKFVHPVKQKGECDYEYG